MRSATIERYSSTDITDVPCEAESATGGSWNRDVLVTVFLERQPTFHRKQRLMPGCPLTRPLQLSYIFTSFSTKKFSSAVTRGSLQPA
ncbi:hypothetical protein BaRGS_00024847 [Batillaria attramentaria]|uniref:Uncharacterized protein n=1 Tax=Batillaria attramentaria TaxID=370345 RepID=A0ABD0KA42_9CAEN